jgi:restriction system protein
MPVPTYDLFVEPVMRYLEKHPEGALSRDVHDAAAEALHLSDTDRAELLPSGTQRVYKNRAGWAYDRLKRAGLSLGLRRGHWQLTEQGRAFASAHPASLPADVLEKLVTEHHDVRLRPAADGEGSTASVEVAVPDRATASPDDRLDQAMAELRETVAAELLDKLSQVSREDFEMIVLDVLNKMKYGTSAADLRRVGRPGDQGIDGVISLDPLGLEKVYVQAKKWRGSVGRPEIQGFYGALAGQRAKKGVFVTTSTFSQQAVDFAASSVERIVLIDGRKLADLMIEHEVGVTTVRSLRVPKLNLEYFEE